jgi:hypothetical protein
MEYISLVLAVPLLTALILLVRTENRIIKQLEDTIHDFEEKTKS